MTTTPTPAEFMTQPQPDEEDELEGLVLQGLLHLSGAANQMAAGGAVEGFYGDLDRNPLESIAASLGLLTSIVVRRDNQELAEDETQQALNQLDREYAELEKLHDAKQGLIDCTLALVSKSTSKLASSIRELLEPMVVPEPATVEPEPPVISNHDPVPPVEPVAVLHAAQPPAEDASVEDWRAYARGLRRMTNGESSIDKMNRSQIRTMLGVEQPAGA